MTPQVQHPILALIERWSVPCNWGSSRRQSLKRALWPLGDYPPDDVFLAKNRHHPPGAISPSTSVQDAGALNRAQVAQD